MILNLFYLTTSIWLAGAVEPLTADMLRDELNRSSNAQDVDDISSMKDLDRDNSSDESKEQKFLDRAIAVVLDPDVIITNKTEVTQDLKIELIKIENENLTLSEFMERMDDLSLTACKKSQNALWAFIKNTSDRDHRKNMLSFAIEDDEIRRRYWETIRAQYKQESEQVADETVARKLRVIEDRALRIVLPENKQRVEIENMQRVWSAATVCAYGQQPELCARTRGKTLGEITKIFESSKNVDELLYYWKEFRNSTGKKIRPTFKTYVEKVNMLARRDNYADAGEIWRKSYGDEDFERTVDRLWAEVRELYDVLLEYVKSKLIQYYGEKFTDKDTMPEHLLGNLWAQQWQEVYSIALPHPKHSRSTISPAPAAKSLSARKIFDVVDDYIQSLGFDSARDSYEDIKDFEDVTSCMISSHDLCDGKNYRVRWCQLSWDLATNYAKAAKLLGYVQYFKQYRSQPIVFRNGPTPAFLEAIPELFASQVTVLNFEKLGDVKTQVGPEVTMNNLFWTALEKLPMMGYGFVLDKWRWDLFANSSLDKWNQHWWDLRKNITGISAPLPRDEEDLDPASAYHVVSHLSYITPMISNILQFQILRSLCKKEGAGAGEHTRPLHECQLYGRKDVGARLRRAMAYGSSRDWRSILKELTNETELSAEGLLDYFRPLKDYLQEENNKLALAQDMDLTTPIIVGVILLILTVIIISVYCLKKHKLDKKVRKFIGKNGSLDITNEMSGKVNEGVSNSSAVEDKV